jgi:exopolyphosphatase/guanosine-5'-triphosphate,3'-diphosphate pyrophosphatase
LPKQTRTGSAGRLAVIDIGSNSARLVVYQRETGSQLRILGSGRQSLRLVREVDRDRRLSVEAIANALKALSDFRSMSEAYGVPRVFAIATAAMRDADNGRELIVRARRELGLRIELIDAAKEAYYGALGGIRALPVNHGVLFDLGGGSVQVVQFKDRRPGRSWSLPLGSLRLSGAFIQHDPPLKREIQALRHYVRLRLGEVPVPRLHSRQVLVGVGGTIRNLAKIDARLQEYPIARIHGYTISRERLTKVVALLCHKPVRSAKSLAGLSREREDSIVGGALAIEALVEAVGGREIVVSGQGVREGLAYSLAKQDRPSVNAVQDAAIVSLAGRFSTWNPEWAERRIAIAARLLDALQPNAHPEIKVALEKAAFLLDIGRSVDYFDRYAHAATMVMDTELDGFSHYQIVLLSTIIALAADERADVPSFTFLVRDIAHAEIKRAAILLRLADDIAQRIPRKGPITIECRPDRRHVHIAAAGLAGWSPRGIASRFEREFKRRLVVS